jgi:hypothetical protein
MNLLNYNFGLDRQNKKHMEKLKDVLAQQGPKRWRAASNLYLYLNPTTKQIDDNGDLVVTVDARTARKAAMAEAKKERAKIDLAGNKFAETEGKNTTTRWGLHFPVGELQFIELIDPNVLSGTPTERRESVRALAKEFPEYRIMRRI